MKSWKKFKNRLVENKTNYSNSIINKLGKCRTDFLKRISRKERTSLIKRELVRLGHKLKCKVYANRLLPEDRDLIKKEINFEFKDNEWMYDIHWYKEKGGTHYMIQKLSLVAECEWSDKKRKGDTSGKKYTEVMFDFQKLLIANAQLRLMIFSVRNKEDLHKLQYCYFEDAIDTYDHLSIGSQFLFVAYVVNEKIEMYYMKMRKK